MLVLYHHNIGGTSHLKNDDQMLDIKIDRKHGLPAIVGSRDHIENLQFECLGEVQRDEGGRLWR